MAGRRDAGDGTFWQRGGRWYGKRRIGPRGAVVTINASGATLDEAKDNLREKVERHLRGGPARISGSVTVAAFLAWWVDEELAQRVADGINTETTRKQYADRVRFQIAPLIGAVRLRDLSAMHLRQWQAVLAKQGASPSLRRRSLAILKTALERAVRYELIATNPAKLVDPPRVERRRRDEITVSTARALLRAAEGDDLEAAYLLALHVPMRVGEVIAAEWDAFDLDRGLFDIRQNLVRVDGRWELHDTKTHTARRVPVPARVVAALRRQHARQAAQRLAAGPAWDPPQVLDVARRQWRQPDFVFTRATGKPHLQQGFYKQLRALCVRADVPPLATHDLRRAANTLLRVAGVDPAVIRQLAGHESEEMTELYTTRLDSLMQQAVDRLAQQLDRNEISEGA